MEEIDNTLETLFDQKALARQSDKTAIVLIYMYESAENIHDHQLVKFLYAILQTCMMLKWGDISAVGSVAREQPPPISAILFGSALGTCLNSALMA